MKAGGGSFPGGGRARKRLTVLCVEVVPCLTVAVEGATAIDVDVIASELEEGGSVLESLEEAICLPIVGVVGEENAALDIWIGSALH